MLPENWARVARRLGSVEFQSISHSQKTTGDHLQIQRTWSTLLPLQLTIQNLCLVELIQLIVIKTLLFKIINSTYKAASFLHSCRTHHLKRGKPQSEAAVRSNAWPLMTPGEGSKPHKCQPDQFSPLKRSPLTRKQGDDEKSTFLPYLAIVNSPFSFLGQDNQTTISENKIPFLWLSPEKNEGQGF